MTTLLGWAAGCASPQAAAPDAAAQDAIVDEPLARETARPAIRDVYLSPGDEIRIHVYGQPDLSRQLVIPPDGQLFFPLAGEIDVTWLSVRELRQTIASRLAGNRETRIVPGDELAVRVHRRPEFSTQAIVPHDGAILLPLAGEVKVGGLSLNEARQAIVERLSDYILAPEVTAQIIRYQGGQPMGDPQVSIDLVRLTGEKFFVLGEVRTPGVFALAGSVTMLDAIGVAGGLLPNAKAGSVLLIRPGSGRRPPETYEIDLNKSLKKGMLTENPVLSRGDVVFVPESGLARTSRFFAHVSNIIRPFVELETGIWLGQNIEAGPTKREPSSNTEVRTIVVPR